MMRLFGLYHDGAFSVSKIYAMIMSTLLVLNLICIFWIFQLTPLAFDLPMISNMQLISWFSLCAANHLICNYTCASRNCLQEFFREWTSCGTSDDLFLKKIKSWVKRCVAVSTVFTILNNIFSWYLLLKSPMLKVMVWPLNPSNSSELSKNLMTAWTMTIHIWYGASWVLPMALQITLCHILSELFKLFNENFKNQTRLKEYPDHKESRDHNYLNVSESISFSDINNRTTADPTSQFSGSSGSLSADGLERLRRHHQTLARMVNICDNFFNYQLGVSLGSRDTPSW